MTTQTRAVLALDQGTTSSRALVFDEHGALLASAQRDLPQHYPRPGWVEHDPEDIWRGQLEAAREALESAGVAHGDDAAAPGAGGRGGSGARRLAAIGVANQRETALLWDQQTGEPVGNAIVWQCRRTTERCEELRLEGREEYLRETTGLRLDPYFSATKWEWLLAAHPEAQRLLAQGRLRAGTVDSFLVWRLTGGREHVTDYSNASRTMLFDLHTLDWDQAALELFGISRDMLPRPVPSAGVVGYSDRSVLGVEAPIAGIAGDQQAALFGQACFAPGETKNTYGTGCFLLMNVGRRPVRSAHDLLSTVAWGLGPGREGVSYALEGSVFAAGAAVQWLRDGLGLIESAGEVGSLAATVEDNGGVYFVPALTGLGAPFWDPAARGLLIGLTRASGRGHVARATEEAICFQTRAVLEAMTKDAGVAPPQLRVDGGAAGDDFLMQLQADVLGVPVARREMREATAFGAAALAGVGVGLWAPEQVAEMARAERVFRPADVRPDLEGVYERWLQAVERSRGWA